jgi:hypothetical protein
MKNVSWQFIGPTFKGQAVQTISCPETSVTDNQSTLRDIPEARSS